MKPVGILYWMKRNKLDKYNLWASNVIICKLHNGRDMAEEAIEPLPYSDEGHWSNICWKFHSITEICFSVWYFLQVFIHSLITLYIIQEMARFGTM